MKYLSVYILCTILAMVLIVSIFHLVAKNITLTRPMPDSVKSINTISIIDTLAITAPGDTLYQFRTDTTYLP